MAEIDGDDSRSAAETAVSPDPVRYAHAFYNVTRRRIPQLPPWEEISPEVMAKIRADGEEIVAEYDRLGE